MPRKSGQAAALPIAASMVSERVASALPARRRVGRYVALALTEDSFEVFRQLILRNALEALHNPSRLLGSQHLYNSVAARIPRIVIETKALIEGFVQELLIAGELRRLVTVSRSHSAYQVVVSPDAEPDVLNGLAAITAVLAHRGTVTLNEAKVCVSKDLAATDQNVEILLGHLLRHGIATRDDLAGSRIETIRLPHADS